LIEKNKFKFCLYGLIASLMVMISLPQLNHSEIIRSSNNQMIPTSAINTSDWQSVPIGGGGYVTGIYVHPQVADLVYMQTDNGGAYRWHPQQQQWENLIDDFPRLPWNYYGVETLALDRQNPELVYLALGKYTSSGRGRLWKSSDRGHTWVESDLQVPMGGNEDKRWTGNRLAVSPHDSNLLLFGSRRDGLWRSTDAGIHWSQVNSFGAYLHPDIGLIAVAFDPQDPLQVYLSAYGDGIYQSHDAGLTWSKMAWSPVHGIRMIVSGDRSLYITSDRSPGVSKYANGVWQDITPQGNQEQIFNALSVHPNDSNQVLVAQGETGDSKIFYSADGGQTWAEKSARLQLNPTVPWWPDYFFNDYNSAVVFDPNFPQRVWSSDWFGVWRTDNFGEQPAIWTNYPQGQEQLVTFSLVSPSQGAVLLSGVADMEGFYHHSLDTYPQERLSHEDPNTRNLFKPWDSYWQDTYGIAYCGTQPLNLVRVGGKRDNLQNTGATSPDGGITWKEFHNFPTDKIPLRVAVSADNSGQFVVIRSEAQPLYTSDNGNSWQQVTGLPDGIPGPWNWVQPLAADGKNGNKFYYYAGGTLYLSNDGGKTFAGVNNTLPSVDNYGIKTVPGVENEVWLSLDSNGLYTSQDGGVNFTVTPQVENAKLLAFGKPQNPQYFPWLYLYGKITDQGEGLFKSGDRGITWLKLDDIPLFTDEVGTTMRVLEASQQETGLIFIGTDGRGIYYRHIT
jgi:xyloglucan-specific exo-beta-1,4-glucanase